MACWDSTTCQRELIIAGNYFAVAFNQLEELIDALLIFFSKILRAGSKVVSILAVILATLIQNSLQNYR